jgi:hypothetical protein
MLIPGSAQAHTAERAMEEPREAPGAPEPDARALGPREPEAEFAAEPEASTLGSRQPAAEDGDDAPTLTPAAAANATPRRLGGGPDTDCDGSSCSGTGTANAPLPSHTSEQMRKNKWG